MSGKIWHEARRQEKKIRGMMVDFRKRAERRREYYERIKLDPTQFLQLHGRPIKIHLDPQVANAAEGPQSMMPWQGDSNNMIDRFDVRAHLDFIPEHKPGTPVELSATEADEERRSNYERYRVLVQNDMTGVSETLCLRQIYLDEKYGAIEDKQKEKEQEMEKKKIAAKKAAIGFTYEDSTPAEEGQQEEADEEKDSEEESDLSDEEIDLDMVVDVDELTEEQVKKFNLCATLYGMEMGDYVQSLRNDKEEQEQIRLARLLEEEKAQFAGRKSRRERRAYKEKKLRERHLSPPSYAARSSPTYEPMSKNFGSGGRKSRRSSSSRSRSRSPETGGIQLITSFGGDSSGEEGKVQVIHGPSLPQHMLPRSLQDSASSHKTSRSRSKHSQDRGRRNSRWDRHGNRRRSSSSRSRSRSRSHRRQRTRSKSRDRGYRRRTRSNSRSRRFSGGRNRRSYSRSRSRSRGRRRSRSRSHSRSRSRSRKRSNVSRSRSRSRSHSKTPPPRPVLPAPTLIRYRQSSSSSSSSSDDDTADSRKNVKTEAAKNLGNSTNKSGTKGGISAAEKLKRRMQLALNKQQRADKMARLEKKEKEIQERMDREDELRSMAIEMRRREREKRHRDREDYYNEPLPEEPRPVKSEERVSKQKVKRSRSRSHSHSPRRRHHRSRSRSRNRTGRRSSPRLVDY